MVARYGITKPGPNLQRADLRAADLHGADLRNADLRSADLRGVDLRAADLRGADLRGARLIGARIGSALLHGADLRGTLLGQGTLVHRGGDPELTWLYDPELSGARADDETRWPTGFSCVGMGVRYEGTCVLELKDQAVTVPAKDPMVPRHPEARPEAANETGRVRDVTGRYAWVSIGASGRPVAGDSLLAANLHLLTGQPVGYRRQTWTIVGNDPARGALALEHRDASLNAPVADIWTKENVNRWWWHVPGAETETLS